MTLYASASARMLRMHAFVYQCIYIYGPTV